MNDLMEHDTVRKLQTNPSIASAVRCVVRQVALGDQTLVEQILWGTLAVAYHQGSGDGAQNLGDELSKITRPPVNSTPHAEG